MARSKLLENVEDEKKSQSEQFNSKASWKSRKGSSNSQVEYLTLIPHHLDQHLNVRVPSYRNALEVKLSQNLTWPTY